MRVNKSLYVCELLVLITLLVLCTICPQKYCFRWSLCAFLLTISGVFFFFQRWAKEGLSFLNFEPVFIIIALVMGFTMPIFIYDGNPETLFLFSWNIPFSTNYINIGAFTTGIGIISFILGSLSYRRSVPQRNKAYTRTNILLKMFLILCVALFIFCGGFQYYQLSYMGEDEAKSSFQFLEVFIIALSELMLFNEFWNKNCDRNYHYKKINIVIPIIIAVIFGLVGNRTVCLYLLLPTVIFLSNYYYRISFPQLIISIFWGGIMMIFLSFLRSNYDYSASYDWYFFLIDLIIPNTTTYLAYDIVNSNGFTYGLSEIGGILGLIPFGQSMFIFITGIDPNYINASNLFTKFLGSASGTGTNFISSSYLAFGLFGVIIFSFLFGKIVQIQRMKSYYSYYNFLCYFVLCGFAVYGVRSSLFYPLRFIFYVLIFAYINKFLNKRTIQ